jgi:hypothetical protein
MYMLYVCMQINTRAARWTVYTPPAGVGSDKLWSDDPKPCATAMSTATSQETTEAQAAASTAEHPRSGANTNSKQSINNSMKNQLTVLGGQNMSTGGQKILAGRLAGDSEAGRVYGAPWEIRREDSAGGGGRDGITAAIDNVVAMVKVRCFYLFLNVCLCMYACMWLFPRNDGRIGGNDDGGIDPVDDVVVLVKVCVIVCMMH